MNTRYLTTLPISQHPSGQILLLEQHELINLSHPSTFTNNYAEERPHHIHHKTHELKHTLLLEAFNKAAEIPSCSKTMSWSSMRDIKGHITSVKPVTINHCANLTVQMSQVPPLLFLLMHQPCSEESAKCKLKLHTEHCISLLDSWQVRSHNSYLMPMTCISSWGLDHKQQSCNKI